MKSLTKALIFFAPLTLATTAFAVEGEVMKINADAGKMTLRHAPIPNLDMDSMQMVFRVADPSMLSAVAVGDKVEFEADRVNGAITIIKIEKTN
jgi:Cu(I)/Ag(I) efflux system protein CusF